jgi:hypothetical protein
MTRSENKLSPVGLGGRPCCAAAPAPAFGLDGLSSSGDALALGFGTSLLASRPDRFSRMATSLEPEFALTSIGTYLAIAKESFAKVQELDAVQRRPRPGGGEVITWDPDQKSFKHSLITIVFAGVYLDALLYLFGRRHLGQEKYSKIERRSYETKLRAFGITDEALLHAVVEFATARNELAHERAYDDNELRTAQEEAGKAIALIERVRSALREASRG